MHLLSTALKYRVPLESGGCQSKAVNSSGTSFNKSHSLLSMNFSFAASSGLKSKKCLLEPRATRGLRRCAPSALRKFSFQKIEAMLKAQQIFGTRRHIRIKMLCDALRCLFHLIFRDLSESSYMFLQSAAWKPAITGPATIEGVG